MMAEGTPAEHRAQSGVDHRPVSDWVRSTRARHTRQGQWQTGDVLRIAGARAHNLGGVTADIPLGSSCVTGVSGSGKSTLVDDILYRPLARHFYRARVSPGRARRASTGLEQIDKVIDIDQSPIGRTPRSNPATYTGLFDAHPRAVRRAARRRRRAATARGASRFNVKGGRCEACQGDGVVKIEMHFLPDVYVPCEVCKGRRYNRETLEVRYKGKSIADVLDITVEDALSFFEHRAARSRDKLQTLIDVGLGYIQLGQPATTLSGGEAQRVKLATELAKRDTGRTLYILDEPTTGLHFEDIRKLLDVLHRLVDKGNTVVVIEHNLDVIKTADWIIDLGPEGGDGGGRIVATGTPEQIAEVAGSYTGRLSGGTCSRRGGWRRSKRNQASKEPRSAVGWTNIGVSYTGSRMGAGTDSRPSIEQQKLDLEQQKQADDLMLARERLAMDARQVSGFSGAQVTLITLVVSGLFSLLTGLVGGVFNVQTTEKSNEGQLGIKRTEVEGQLAVQKMIAEADRDRLAAQQSFDIVVQATKGLPQETAAANLLFFVKAGILRDPDGKIQLLAETGKVPDLPWSSTGTSNPILSHRKRPIRCPAPSRETRLYGSSKD